MSDSVSTTTGAIHWALDEASSTTHPSRQEDYHILIPQRLEVGDEWKHEMRTVSHGDLLDLQTSDSPSPDIIVNHLV